MYCHRSLMSLAAVGVRALATGLALQGYGGAAMAQPFNAADAIEGVWESSVTLLDCASQTPLLSFKGVSVFHRGGTVSADNSMPPWSRGAAFGKWERSPGTGAQYKAFLYFMRFNPDGTLAGSQKVQRTFVLGAGGRSLDGTLITQVLDTAGNVQAQVCGIEVGGPVL